VPSALCDFCDRFFQFASGGFPPWDTICLFADPECAPWDQRVANLHAILDNRRQSHCDIRAAFLLPCDSRCPRQTVAPERGASLIERVKAAYRIEDVAGRLTEMRWNGDRGMGRCPFHDDRSPSFSVDIGKQKWHCFAACGHGDVIDMLRLAKERGLAYG
jgi:hypothetical protein